MDVVTLLTNRMNVGYILDISKCWTAYGVLFKCLGRSYTNKKNIKAPIISHTSVVLPMLTCYNLPTMTACMLGFNLPEKISLLCSQSLFDLWLDVILARFIVYRVCAFHKNNCSHMKYLHSVKAEKVLCSVINLIP